MRFGLARGLVPCGVLLLAGVSTIACAGPEAPRAQPRQLVWHDEFDGSEGSPPDPSRWMAKTGGGGWGNDELQCYTDSTDNAFLDGHSHLVIRAVAVAEACDGRRYTSARLTTEASFTFTHGRIEVRALLPSGGGTWPAIWALGADIAEVGWPRTGEIDVMEHVGNRPGIVSGTVHGEREEGGHWYLHQETAVTGLTNDFHVYTAEWSRSTIAFSVDGRRIGSVTRSEVERLGAWVYDKPFYLLLNLAMGGTLGGSVSPQIAWPQDFVVDYVRVYR